MCWIDTIKFGARLKRLRLSIKSHSMPLYDKQYIKAKVREFIGVVKTNFFS